jgi:hypothetical protein
MERENGSQKGVEPEIEEDEESAAKTSKKKIHKLKLSQVKVSSRAREALKNATGPNQLETQKTRKESSGAFARTKQNAPEEVNFEASTILGKPNHTLETMEGELTCPICLELFAKPVTLNEWYFHLTALLLWWCSLT